MDRTASPGPRLAPFAHGPAPARAFAARRQSLVFLPNSVLIPWRRPTLAQAGADVDAGNRNRLAGVESVAAPRPLNG